MRDPALTPTKFSKIARFCAKKKLQKNEKKILKITKKNFKKKFFLIKLKKFVFFLFSCSFSVVSFVLFIMCSPELCFNDKKNQAIKFIKKQSNSLRQKFPNLFVLSAKVEKHDIDTLLFDEVEPISKQQTIEDELSKF